MLVASLLAVASMAGGAVAASLQQVTNFGTNPTKINMYIYVPDKLATKPAIVVGVRRSTFSQKKYN